MSVTLEALVLPAFDDLEGLTGEDEPWRRAYDFEPTAIEGLPGPLLYTDSGLGLVPTGIGTTAAATTTATLCASGAVDLDDALVCSVGVAGGPPSLPIGSVVLADSVVEWDDKCRFDPEDGSVPLAPNPYTEGQGRFGIDPDLLARAESLASDVSLDPPATTARADATPEVLTGTNLCGDELWHGRELAEQASWLVEQYDAGPYCATEMEDAGTAAALERFGHLDRYLSVRGISNHDRQRGGESARESFFDPRFEDGFDVGLENAVAVARAVIDDRLA